MESNSQDVTELLIELKDYESQTFCTNSTKEEENDIMAFETPGGDILIAQSENCTKNLKDDVYKDHCFHQFIRYIDLKDLLLLLSVSEQSMRDFLIKSSEQMIKIKNFQESWNKCENSNKSMKNECLDSLISQYKVFDVLLIILFIDLIFSIFICTKCFLMSDDEVSEIQKNNSSAWKIVTFVAIFDLVNVVFTLILGVAAKCRSSIPLFKFYSYMLFLLTYTAVLNIYLSKINVLFMLSRISSFVVCRRIISTIYSSIVYSNLERIKDPIKREAYVRFLSSLLQVKEYDYPSMVFTQIR